MFAFYIVVGMQASEMANLYLMTLAPIYRSCSLHAASSLPCELAFMRRTLPLGLFRDPFHFGCFQPIFLLLPPTCLPLHSLHNRHSTPLPLVSCCLMRLCSGLCLSLAATFYPLPLSRSLSLLALHLRLFSEP